MSRNYIKSQFFQDNSTVWVQKVIMPAYIVHAKMQVEVIFLFNFLSVWESLKEKIK